MNVDAHGEPADGHGSKFHFSAAGSFQAAYDEPLKQGVTSATAEKDHYAEK